ncbi:hypothetical protein KSP39_PZI004727 [Platanthera zijinensis]|uniref:Tf2-1-like SH3-like domain-containing protein n=1 Tax=Platanthera zijinensis TaxID=2320716 RepID=A0AAP0BYD1_9ASPA
MIEFVYNINFQATIKMTSNEALYGRRCQTPMSWVKASVIQLRKKQDIAYAFAITETICDRMGNMQDRQAKYYNTHPQHVKFAVGDMVYLKIKPFKAVSRIRQLKKSRPRYLGPFLNIKRIGECAYSPGLSAALNNLHDVF